MSECLDLIEGYEELRLRAYEELHADAVRRFRELADSVPAIKDVVEGYLSRFNDVVDVRVRNKILIELILQLESRYKDFEAVKNTVGVVRKNFLNIISKMLDSLEEILTKC
jgi:hypothetical protein